MASKLQRGDIAVTLGSKSIDRGDAGSFRVSRKSRRFGLISQQRLSVWLLVIGATFFVFMTFFSVKVHLHGEKEDGMSSFISVQKRDLRNNILKRKKSLKHYPCDIELAKSVEYIMDPKDYLNFTHFELDYVGKEEQSLMTSQYTPKFAGHQTLEQRKRSFYAKNQSVHCGFVKGPDGVASTGFDLDEKDQNYMKSCTVAVSSCIFGSSDFLRRPTSKLISEYSKTHVCFVMFLDEETLLKLKSEGNIPDERGHMGLWRIVVVKNLPYEDMRRTGKVPKLLAHRLFPSARYSIWLDSKMRLNADPLLILEYFLWRTKSECTRRLLNNQSSYFYVKSLFMPLV